MKKKLELMNNDISFEVFSRLSTRDLQLVKFVSKEWGRLISNNSFICLHLKKKETVSGFFFQDRCHWDVSDIDHSDISYFPIESRRNVFHRNVFNFLPERVVIVLDSCDGLILCRSSTLSANDPKLYICNPLNKEWISLEWLNPSKDTSFSLVFDKSSSLLSDDPLDFEVVAVSGAETDDESGTEECELSFHIYSSSNKTWRKSTQICCCNDTLISKKSVYADGSLYWLTKGPQIIKYDLKMDLCFLISVPLHDTGFRMRITRSIGESQGKLHYVVLSENGFQLWVLKREPLSVLWDQRIKFSINELEMKNPEFLYELGSLVTSLTSAEMALWIKILAFKDDILLIRVSTDLHFFYFETGKLRRLCVVSEVEEMSMNFAIVIPYTMSLAPLVSL